MVPCVKLGMPVNEEYDERPALCIALYHNEFSTVKELLHLGADPNMKFRIEMDRNMGLVTPLQSVPVGIYRNYFSQTRGLQYLKLLVKQDADLSVGRALRTSIFYEQYETAKYLVNEGSNVEKRGYYRMTPLMTAVLREDINLTRLLYSEGGASPNSRISPNIKNLTPFMLAVSRNYTQIVKHFLEDPKQIRRELENVLHNVWGFTKTIIDIIRSMTRPSPIDFSLTDGYNRTVFDLANSDTMKSLLLKGLN